MGKYFIGIDSGGTKTAVSVIDKEKKEVLNFETETGHYLQIGFEGLENLLKNILDRVQSQLDISLNEVGYIFAGIPGYGEIKEDKLKIEKVVEKSWGTLNYQIGNDMKAGWAGSLACEPGINIIAGTGAIAYGINELGEEGRSSGWGHACGDEGSAHWIAKKGIEVFTKQSDGRLDKTKFYEIFRNRIGLQDDFDLIDIVYNKYTLDRGKIAKLSLVVYEAALANEEYSKAIFKEAAVEIGLMIKAIVNQIEFINKPIKISYTGGVFKASDYIFNHLEEYLSKNKIDVKILEPKYSPVYGSALYSLKLWEEVNAN
ncbi:BadF/BadG/BcrA/BcrD ATPase family protein [uncultured Cetobacterium sp.]|uniref:BadF/BadG/BcrA/BcrD ATPase family protein n=1 Tax=uncultured Cetobacterium sp. TaxID=527638 RepID=UPI00260F9098|nr:BadF/BadG/BcrA/BcrD ATPase family protein [uncultured Cetobacterium sp.]